MALTCPSPNDKNYQSLLEYFNKDQALMARILYSRELGVENDPKTPTVLKAFKLLKLNPDIDIVYKERNKGFKTIKRIVNKINFEGAKLSEEDVIRYNRKFEDYGYDDLLSITLEPSNNKYIVTNKQGDYVDYRDIPRTSEQVDYENKLYLMKDKLSEELSGVLDFINKSYNSSMSTITKNQILYTLKTKAKSEEVIPNLETDFNKIKTFFNTGVYSNDNSELSEITTELLLSLLSSDKAFNSVLARLANEENIEEVIKYLKENGIELSRKDLESNLPLAVKALNKIISTNFFNLEVNQIPFDENIQALVSTILDKLHSILNQSDYLEQLSNSVSSVAKEYNQELNELKDKYNIANEALKSFEDNPENNLSNLENILRRRHKILLNIINNEYTQSALSEKGSTKKDLHKKRIVDLYSTHPELLSQNEKDIDFLSIIVEFLDNEIIEDFKHLYNLLLSHPFDTSKISTNAKILRKIKITVKAYDEILKNLKEEVALIHNNTIEPNTSTSTNEILRVINSLESLSSSLSSVYKEFETKFLTDYFSSFIPEETIVLNGKEFSVKDILFGDTDDIGFIDRFLRSTKDSNSTLLRLMNEPVSRALARKYNRTLEHSYKLERLHRLLTNGDSSFMYERDKGGNPTGYFIKRENDAFSKAWQLYKINNKDKDISNRKLYNSFLSTVGHYDNEGYYMLNEVYQTSQYARLSPNQKKYYSAIIQMKEEAERELPFHYRNRRLAPQVRKNDREQLLGNEGNIFSKIKNVVKGNLTVTTNDSEIIEESNIDGTSIRRVPIRYNKKFDDTSELSMDATGSMLIYLDNINAYAEMSAIVDAMEVFRSRMRETTFNEKRYGQAVKTKIQGFEKTIDKKIAGDAVALIQRIDDFYESNIYGRVNRDDGTILNTNISKRKSVSLLIKAMVANTLALNLLQATANITTGLHNIILEGAGGDVFRKRDVVASISNYMKNIPHLIADLEARNKTSKVNVLDEYFRITQGKEDEFIYQGNYKTGRLGRLLKLDNLFFLQNMGEHMLANVIGESYLRSIKVIKNGRETNLYDAIETKDGIAITNGIKNLDGTDFSEEDRVRIMRQIREISEMTQGIYNKENIASFQRGSVGALMFLYRRYVIPNVQRRFAYHKNYNFILGKETEGFYVTTYRFVKNLIFDSQQLGRFSTKYWKELTREEKANVKKSIFEVASYVLLSALFSSIKGLGDDEDDPYFNRLMVYSLRRTITEIGAFMPNIELIDNMSTIFKSPVPALDWLGKNWDLLKVNEYGEVIKSGAYKDWYKWQKNIVEFLPFYKGLYRSQFPEQNLKYLEQDNK